MSGGQLHLISGFCGLSPVLPAKLDSHSKPSHMTPQKNRNIKSSLRSNCTMQIASFAAGFADEFQTIVGKIEGVGHGENRSVAIATPFHVFKIAALSGRPKLRSSQTWLFQFQTWLFAIFMRMRFCTLLRPCVCAHLHSFARICVFLRPTAFRTTAFWAL